MKSLKENPFLLSWLILLTVLTIYHFFYTNVNVQIKVNGPEGATVIEKHEIKKS